MVAVSISGQTVPRHDGAEAQSHCVCCGHSGVTWLDWSPTYREVVCSVCDSQPRHRLLCLYMMNETQFFILPLKVLHIAPKPSLEKRIRTSARLQEYVTADLYRDDVDVRCDITALPFQTDYFDIVLCNHVFEHVARDRDAMAEIYRVLSPGGWASLLVPLSSEAATIEGTGDESDEDRLRLFGQEDHVRIYGQDYLDRLRGEGFVVNLRDYGTTLGMAREYHGLLGCEQLCIGYKK